MNKAHITGEHPVVAEVRMPRPYRAALAVAALCFSIAMLIGAFLVIGPARDAARHSAASEALDRQSALEADCRNTIAAVLADATSDLATAQADFVLQLSDSQATAETKLASRMAFSAAKERNVLLSDIRGDAVQICHDNPYYRLPDPLTKPGGTPP